MLVLENVSLQLNRQPILQTISAQFAPGIHSIVGKSGSGKTSLLRCIANLESYTGTISGYDLKQTAYLEQHLTLFPQFTLAENVAFPLKVRHCTKTEQTNRVHSLLAQCQLEDLAKRYPHQLSGGEQRRAMLARCLVYTPQLLLCDEPFSALDAITRIELVKWFKTLVTEQAMTVLYVTHDLAEAKFLSPQLNIMEAGQLAVTGNWDTIQHPLLNSQF